MKMNKYNYLNALSNIIQNELPADEYNNVMQYYSEYFADAGVEKEQDVMAALGTPEELAVSIIAEQRGKQPEEVVVKTKRKGLPLGWIIAIAIVGSPIWLALLCVVIALAACVCFGGVICGVRGKLCDRRRRTYRGRHRKALFITR